MNKIFNLIIIVLLLGVQNIGAQQTEVGPHDFGRMWTFENPPKTWFQEQYGFEANDEWFDRVREASLKFGSWCSASFVSPDGLIMTNHHCSGHVTIQVEEAGEDFTKNGFYAATLEDERKVNGLFVEQLVHAEDVTNEVNRIMATSKKSISLLDAVAKIKAKYEEDEEFKNLRIQHITYYNGEKHAIHAYKRYDDIRLVLVPEVVIGFFGGDDDNFTYPRYNLDFTFWRAYDEKGHPVNSSEHYFKFNLNGPEEGEVVFVSGNPARTERYRTVSQLEFDRDNRYPLLIHRNQKMYDKAKRDYEKSPSNMLMNQIIGVGNRLKVFNGIQNGLLDPNLFGRKVEMEKMLREKYAESRIWDEMDDHINALKPYAWSMNLLGPSRDKGRTYDLMTSLENYETAIREGKDSDALKAMQKDIKRKASKIGGSKDREALISLLQLVKDFIPCDVNTLEKLTKGSCIEKYVEKLYTESAFNNKEKLDLLFEGNPGDFLLIDDPLLLASRALIGDFNRAKAMFAAHNPAIDDLQQSITTKVFEHYGSDLPPDATFTLRISDGVVGGYDYNGTIAPYKTTFFGLYDRYYSHEAKTAWNIPEKWLNPPIDFLRTPINFVSTNDIIGGNSGSPVINKNLEVVGLIFDGNIESLPGNFIFDEKSNRAVSVHSAGILAVLQYIYKAKRLSMELLGKH